MAAKIKSKKEENMAFNANIIAFLKKKGFVQALHRSYDIVFSKEETFELDLGENVIDEMLKSPQYSSYHKMKDYYEKYGISFGGTSFFDTQIYRKQKISITFKLRFALKTNYDSKQIEYSTSYNLLDNVMSNPVQKVCNNTSFNDIKFDLATVKRIFTNEIDQWIKEALSTIKENIPELIETLQEKVAHTKLRHKQAIRRNKLEQFLDGAIVQFDALYDDN